MAINPEGRVGSCLRVAVVDKRSADGCHSGRSGVHDHCAANIAKDVIDCASTGAVAAIVTRSTAAGRTGEASRGDRDVARPIAIRKTTVAGRDGWGRSAVGE